MNPADLEGEVQRGARNISRDSGIRGCPTVEIWKEGEDRKSGGPGQRWRCGWGSVWVGLACGIGDCDLSVGV